MILYRTTYNLTLQLATRAGDPPPEIPLRHLLKHALRAWGIRCLKVAPAATPGEPRDVEAAAGAAEGADAV
jgi:hypothetical protein